MRFTGLVRGTGKALIFSIVLGWWESSEAPLRIDFSLGAS